MDTKGKAVMSSTKSAGGEAKKMSRESKDYLPTKFHCREGSQCLTTRARWEAWCERETLRAQHQLPIDVLDKQPPLPLHGHHIHTAEALLKYRHWFLKCGHFVCRVPHPESKTRLCCADVHKYRCKGDGSLDVDALTRLAIEQGVLTSKLRKLSKAAGQSVCVM